MLFDNVVGNEVASNDTGRGRPAWAGPRPGEFEDVRHEPWKEGGRIV